MPLSNLLAPLVARKALELKQQIDPPMQRGYLQSQAFATPVTEAQGYAQMDRDRQAALAADTARATALEAMGSRGTHGVFGQVGDTGADKHARLDALANKQTWSGQDLKGLSDDEIAAARHLRSQRTNENDRTPTLRVPGYLPELRVEGKRGNARVEVDSYKPALGDGYLAKPYTGGYVGKDVPSPYAPQPLTEKDFRDRSAQGAAKVISDDLQRRFAYLFPST